MSQWSSSDDKNFNLQEFYNTIVVMFEKDPQHPWVVETLEWWNEYLHYFIYLESYLCFTNKYQVFGQGYQSGRSREC